MEEGIPSPNPGGRPKTAPLAQACRELLAAPLLDDSEGRTYAEAIAQTLAKKALAGDIRAAQEIADRAEGRARQSIEVQSVTLRDAFERMSREELEAYARGRIANVVSAHKGGKFWADPIARACRAPKNFLLAVRRAAPLPVRCSNREKAACAVFKSSWMYRDHDVRAGRKRLSGIGPKGGMAFGGV